MNSKKKILIAHCGFSSWLHLNLYEVNARFLQAADDVEVHAIVCNQAARACDYQHAVADFDFDRPPDWRVNCAGCERKLKERYSVFCDRIIDLNDLIIPEDHRRIDAFISGLGKSITLSDYRRLEFEGIQIGLPAYDAFLYYYATGHVQDRDFKLTPGRGAYEFLHSALIHIVCSKKIIQDYAYVLVNDHVKGSWGVWAISALAHGRKVFYAGWNYYRQDMHRQLMPMVYTSLRELRSRFPAFPGLERIQKAFQRMDEDSGIIASGKAALNRHFEIKRVNGDIRSLLNLPGDRTVAVVFAHLCYDPSSTVGFLPFDYFEQWLTATYEEAVQNRGVVWVFKLHPHELAGRLHPRYNTRNHLERLAKRHPSDNIRVIETDVTTYDLLPVTDIGVTAVGDVSWELPAYGVNCITLTRALNSDFGFTIDLTTEADYRTALRNIQHFPPLSHTQQRRAQAYAGLLYADEQSIDAGNLFSETERDAERLDAGTLNAFVRCNLDTFTKIIGRRKI